ncbi:zinc-binding alcohol dehydrogenase family protein [Spirosoma sp. BT702]|uniref:Zinc-type alcohol dehydrogenase-like protein n=1 Tax=Spirosoma profusum TaxID=2771354 RepID=A0A927AV71_9BACT|nr:zinc-binding alcohol dehydrogenase family protein [Spirosoma profusum]MBD2705017.1 zinc-binding alcohol dehydrogenase family protein [Spirosoma profusum]
MKAIGFKTSLPISEPESFIEFETPTPQPTGRDLLVKIKAISVNPVDFKIRQNSAKDTVLPEPKIIGWDAAGVVEAVGKEVSLFKPGDEVYYAGDLTRSGTNAEYQLIDERIVGRKPTTLNEAESASMPLTVLTAWEILFDRLRISADKDSGKSILMIGGAGGVGSIAIQLAKKLAHLKVIATASRPETQEWCKSLGADVVISHQNLVENVRAAGFKEVDFILDFVDINGYWDAIAELIKPQGHIASITGSSVPLALNKLKNKSVTFSWEFMYTRSMFQTDDMIQQHNILSTVAKLLDDGTLKTTLNKTIIGFTVENLKEAHRLQESGKTIGKTVILY